jgi:potassium efflux system protein
MIHLTSPWLSRWIRLLIVGAVLGGVPFFGPSAAEPQSPAQSTIESWDAGVDSIAARLKASDTSIQEERQLRRRLQTTANAAFVAERDATARASRIKGLLAALGPKPKQGEETASVNKRRQDLEADLALYEGKAKQLKLILAKTRQVTDELESRSRQRLSKQLFERTVTPIGYRAWAAAIPEAGDLFHQTAIEAPRQWWRDFMTQEEERRAVSRNVLVILALSIAAVLAGRWSRRRFGRVHGIEEPTYSRRVLAGLAEGVGRTVGPIVFVILTGLTILDSDITHGTVAALVVALMKSLSVFLLGHALINATLTSKRQQWRLLDLDPAASRYLVTRLRLTLVVFLVLNGSRLAVSWATPSAELEAVSALVFALAMVPLLISLLANKAWRKPSAEPASAPLRRWRAFAILAFSAFPIVAAIGYPGLATYLIKCVVVTSVFGTAILALRAAGREGLAATLDSERRFGRVMADTLALDAATTRQIIFWLRVLLDIVLIAVAGLLLPQVWGFSTEETLGSAGTLLQGIKIGSYTLSLVDIMVGVALFSGLIFLTHLLQRGLERHLLPNLSSDKGVRDALKTGVGYVGFVIASLVGISALGLDLSNLALIAGALSVGLGFGLQNVVNNFVSGLILLVERPIKAGDWVVIGGQEGKVKKVNVRSTEVETFQRASVIIPNADLISSPVVNWTHKNMLGRVEVSIGVAYGTDPRKVEKILLDCAKAHPNVIATPEPFVLFMDFGDSALVFELRAFLSDVERRIMTASDLRYAINEAFQAAGIEIPFPQRVLHMATGAEPPKAES